VATVLGVDVVGVRRQRPPHQALVVVDLAFFSSASGAAAPLVHGGRQAHRRVIAQLQTNMYQRKC
jgi:hypothetical protein